MFTRHRDKLIPLVVGLPLCFQNLDSAIMGTALPAMATALRVDTLRLNIAITAYLISLAIFLPASGWIADRFGSRRVFCCAIAMFSAASALCGLANSLEMLVAFRVVQGIGGAMMIPVGRLILLRNVDPRAMVAAMVWFTMPPVLGRMIGPVFGGLAVTWLSWRWIFLVNIPLGILGIVLALLLLEPGEATEKPPAFDFTGFALLGIGLAACLAALESASSKLAHGGVAAALGAIGAAALAGYWAHSRRVADPLIDLRIFRFRTFFCTSIGGLPFRLGIGAMPLLLPLLLQVGFGMSPMDSGLLTLGTAVGALATRVVMVRFIRRYGFRPVLVCTTLGASLSFAGYALLSANTPAPMIFAVFAVGGLMFSLGMTSLQTLSFSEMPKPLMGQATAMSTMVQQLSFSLGVLLAVELLRASVWWRGDTTHQLLARDFTVAFVGIAAAILVGIIWFSRLPDNVGAEYRDK